MPPKHFNKAHVFGVVEETKTTKAGDGFVVKVILKSRSDQYGNVRAYCDLWNKNGTDFLAWHKDHRGEVIKLTGRLGKFEKDDGVVLSNFTIYEWEARPGAKQRVTAQLTGYVAMFREDEDGQKTVTISVQRPKAKSSDEVYEESFDIHIHERDAARIGDLGAHFNQTVACTVLYGRMDGYNVMTDEVEGPLALWLKEVKVHGGDNGDMPF